MIIDTEFNSAAQIPSKIVLDAAVLAERQGFGCVWKGESNSRDPMVLLSAMAARTSTLELGTAIYHVFGRSPVTLGFQAATLNEMSDGRLILGLGVGNPVIAAWHGQEFDRPLRRMREYVEILRAVYSGEKVPDYEGDFYSTSSSFKLAFRPPDAPLRLWIAGLGPQMARLAGKLSDGIVINIANPPIIREIVENARDGARDAGRDPEALEVVSKIRVSLAEDPADARWALKKVLTFYSLQKGYAEVLCQMGFEPIVRKVQETHRSEGFAAARKLVPDEMFDVVPMYAGSDLSGLPARLKDYEAAGSTRCVAAYVPSGDDLWGEIKRYLELAEFAASSPRLNPMDFALSDDQRAIQEAIRDVCAGFPGQYWRKLEETGDYPEEFVRTLTDLGWLSTLIPEEYGGGGLGITEAAIILEEIHRSGANANACHAQMYTMGTVLRHGSDEQKKRYLPEIAAGRLRLQAFGITEPDAGSDTTKLRTRAVRDGDSYLVTGQKVYISRVQHSDLMLLLARTSAPREEGKRTAGLSVFLVDLRAGGDAIQWERIPMMFNHHTYQVFFNEARVPADNLIGEEGQGFRYIIDGWNAERILIASEAIGDGHYFVDRASAYASEREVFDRPIGANQGVQFPIAQAHASVEAASLMRFDAASRFDAGVSCGAQANMAKLLASQASWTAANACMTAFGGNAFASEYDVERKFREAKLLEIAPVSNNLVLAYLSQHVLGMPRSY